MAAHATFTIIDEGRPTAVTARVLGDRVWLSPAGMKAALGWELKPEGLCRGDVCVPCPDGLLEGARGSGDRAIDLTHLAAVLRRPVALDGEERAAYLGAPAQVRAEALASLAAPDFTIPDLLGRSHSLADHRGKNVFLVAYASW
jgi:hypothetical protein